MQIIIEGLDGSGKSTLARMLELELKAVCSNSHGVPKSDEDVIERTLNELKNIKYQKKYLRDRSQIISQFVYGGINSGVVFDKNFLIDKIMKMQGVLIFCDSVKEEDYKERLRTKHTLKYQDLMFDKFAELHKRYIQVVCNWQGTVIQYNYKEDSFEDLIKGLKHHHK